MITSQEIRSKTFEKAVIGGYDMGGIDNFIDEVAEDFALLQKENTTLRGKMRVLAKSVEEYRSNEDALRMALISAQKLCVAIEKEARENAEHILAKATAEATRILEDANSQAELEAVRLAEAKRTTAQSIAAMSLMCQNQLDALKKIAETSALHEFAGQSSSAKSAVTELLNRMSHTSQPAEDVHETVKSIEETVARAAASPVLDVKPEIQPAVPEADEAPTRQFDVISDHDTNVDGPFLFDNFGEN